MANIRNSISLQDHMTPVFRSILRSMDSTLRVMRQLDRQANNGIQSKAYQTAAKDIQRANNALIKMQNNLKRADSSASKLSKTMSGISSFNFTNLASAVYLLKNAVTGLTDLMKIPDSLNQAQYRLQHFDTTGATGQQLYNQTYRTALDSRTDLASTANLASRILVSGATDGDGSAAVHMAGLLNKSVLLGGATQEEASRALLQLSQGLGSGVLQGDELRSIREQAPGLTDTLAKGLSSMAERGALPDKFLDITSADLKQLGADGELTADRIMAAFSEVEDYINETFDKSPKTFGQAMTGISTIWQNFFKMMGEGDNAFAQITEKAWELFDFFNSEEGVNFFEELGGAINLVVGGIINLIDWFTSLSNAGLILKSVFISLTIVAAAYAIAMLVAFVASYWQVLLVIAVIALLVYVLMSAGLSIGQIVGGVIGFIAAAVIFIWDIIVFVIWAIYDIIVLAVTAVILVIQVIVQIIMWVIATIWAGITMLGEVWNSVWNGFQIIVKGVVLGIVSLFAGMADVVLGIIQKIAEGIDWVFGSNLAKTVSGWRDGLDSAVDDLETKLNIEGDVKDIGDGWKDWASNSADLYTDTFNIIPNMGNVIDGAGNMMAAGDNVAMNAMGNPMSGWNWGMGIGEDLDASLSSFDMSGMEDILSGGIPIDGGTLDSVGSVGSDVTISDEDIQLLKDIAARDFLVNVQTVTPKANIKFGDVRETADVNKIVGVIEDMVEEQLATALVVE